MKNNFKLAAIYEKGPMEGVKKSLQKALSVFGVY